MTFFTFGTHRLASCCREPQRSSTTVVSAQPREPWPPESRNSSCRGSSIKRTMQNGWIASASVTSSRHVRFEVRSSPDDWIGFSRHHRSVTPAAGCPRSAETKMRSRKHATLSNDWYPSKNAPPVTARLFWHLEHFPLMCSAVSTSCEDSAAVVGRDRALGIAHARDELTMRSGGDGAKVLLDLRPHGLDGVVVR